MAKIRKGDRVTVLSGKDKGKEGSINSINPYLILPALTKYN